MLEEILSLAGDDGQRIVDFMAGAGGELGQGVELANVQSLLVGAALLLKRPVQLI